MWDLADRKFRLIENNAGVAGDDTFMVFGRDDDPWRATYHGPGIAHGQAIVSAEAQGLSMLYHAHTQAHGLVAGQATVTLSQTDDIYRMELEWRWLDGPSSGAPQGRSVWQEAPGVNREVVRNAAYGVIVQHDPDPQILLCRLSAKLPRFQGHWTLPGGGLEFGETPQAAVVREVLEETGLTVEVDELLDIDTEVIPRPRVQFQPMRFIYRANVIGGVLQYEQDGTTDMCAWVDLPLADDTPVVALVRHALQL